MAKPIGLAAIVLGELTCQFCSASSPRPTTGLAQAQANCGEAWYQRSQIYKEAGYCFQTHEAIQVFGNAGCSYDNTRDVPLPANQRAGQPDRRLRAE